MHLYMPCTLNDLLEYIDSNSKNINKEDIKQLKNEVTAKLLDIKSDDWASLFTPKYSIEYIKRCRNYISDILRNLYIDINTDLQLYFTFNIYSEEIVVIAHKLHNAILLGKLTNTCNKNEILNEIKYGGLDKIRSNEVKWDSITLDSPNPLV